MADERENDAMWQRINEHGSRLSEVEQRVTRNEQSILDHGRQLSDLSHAANELRGATSEMLGGFKVLRYVAIGIGALVAILELASAVGAFAG